LNGGVTSDSGSLRRSRGSSLARDNGDGRFGASAAWGGGNDAFGCNFADFAVRVDFSRSLGFAAGALGDWGEFGLVCVGGGCLARIANWVFVAPGGVAPLSVDEVGDGDVLSGPDVHIDAGGSDGGGSRTAIGSDTTG